MYLALKSRLLCSRKWRQPEVRIGGLAILFLALLFHSAVVQSRRSCQCYAEERSAPEYRFSFESEDLILVPVELFGRKYPFVLDTGASCSVLDECFRPELGIPVDQKSVSTDSKRQTLDFFASPELEICTLPKVLRFQGDLMICADLGDLRSGSDRESWGILGMDFLQTRIVRLNFDQLTCEFGGERTEEFTQFEKIQFSKGTPHLHIRLPVEGYKSFQIDSGGEFFVTLEASLFKKLVDRRKIVVRTRATFAELNGTSTAQIGVLESIEFGSHRFSNVPVDMGGGNRVGLKFLRCFEIELDFPNRIGRFRPGKRIDLANRRNWSGMGIRRVSGQTLAVGADESSISGQAGLRHNDQLRTVNGIAIDELKLQKIRELLSTPGTEVTITFERNRQSMKAVLVLPAEVNPFPAKLPHEVIATSTDFDK